MTKGLSVFFDFLTTLAIIYNKVQGEKKGDIPRLWYAKCYRCGISGMKKTSYLCSAILKFLRKLKD